MTPDSQLTDHYIRRINRAVDLDWGQDAICECTTGSCGDLAEYVIGGLSPRRAWTGRLACFVHAVRFSRRHEVEMPSREAAKEPTE